MACVDCVRAGYCPETIFRGRCYPALLKEARDVVRSYLHRRKRSGDLDGQAAMQALIAWYERGEYLEAHTHTIARWVEQATALDLARFILEWDIERAYVDRHVFTLGDER